MSATVKRIRLTVTGTVQGVGFRPFIANLARELDLTGFVFNSGYGVTIEVQGNTGRLDAFVDELKQNPPSLSSIEALKIEQGEVQEEMDFRIESSRESVQATTLIPPDIATCAECLEEINDPGDRRYHYPFTSCTQCGPRFTIIERLPYDRENTSMEEFPLCRRCSEEYGDFRDRRFHAETNACPECGPRLKLLTSTGEEMSVNDPLVETTEAFERGQIIAIKGLGGFHIACDGSKDEPVSKLRARKRRSSKPFAVMFPDIEKITSICSVSPQERALLTSRERHIVLLKTDFDTNNLSPLIAPGLNTIGAMLPYTPLHELLLRGMNRPLIMTSGNLSDEAIVFRDENVIQRLGPLVDLIVTHKRRIVASCDDSVVKTWSGGTIVLRRSRGYVLSAVPCGAVEGTEKLTRFTILGCGGMDKSTFCYLKNGKAVLSQHLGDLENEAALRNYEQSISHLSKTFGLTPAILAHDLHPDYPSTRFALRYREKHPEVRLIPVQHHQAHLAGVLAENNHRGKAIGVCWDGTGLGEDGTIWGSEFLVGDMADSRRVGGLKPVVHPGGDLAAKEIWRMTLAYLKRAFPSKWASIMENFYEVLPVEKIEAVGKMVDGNFNCPRGSSMGRLFDAIGSLCLGVLENDYEGQAAMGLEEAALRSESTKPLLFHIEQEGGMITADPGTVFQGAVERMRRGSSPESIALAFHRGLALMVRDICKQIKCETGISTVALSGGCFQNALLLDSVVAELTRAGFEVFTHQTVPPNDGGLSFGQAVVAAARINKES